MSIVKCWLGGACLLILAMTWAPAIEEADLLDPTQAFALTVTAQAADTVVAQWSIAEGYFLYRARFRFESNTPGIRLGEIDFPPGAIKEDAFFGKMEIYRKKFAIALPVLRTGSDPEQLELKVISQGCADAGVCYPPQIQTVTVALPASPKTNLLTALTTADKPIGGDRTKPSLLDPEQAFILSVTTPDPHTLVAQWSIAEGYYLYRDKLKLELVDAGDLAIASLDIPAGESQADEFFGRQEIFHQQATATARLQGPVPQGGNIKVRVSYQGCAELGVCYPPQTQLISLSLAALEPSAPTAALAAPPKPIALEAEQDRMARLLTEQRYWALPAFFGFGLLLAFTPCVFPMIPILSSLIAGEGKALTQRRAFLLSLIYVLAMAVTYTVAGVLAALLGQNIQALFQNPWVLTGFSALFVVLALSMFGFYDLQLPSRWQSRLAEFSNRRRGGNYLGVAGMGLLSALIVGPCVAPPLIGALTVIAATGDATLGGTALFFMSLGMGAPLLIIGTSAGRLLPRAGHWMERSKAVFGVLLLAVALWMLERILPAQLSMLGWATLLIVCATYMGALQPLAHDMPAWHTLVKGLGVVLLIYGILLLVGVAAGGKDTWQPLRGANFTVGLASQPGSLFKPIKTVADLEQALTEAKGRPALLDFYADWCVTCKELEKYTFSNPAVQAALSEVVLLRADVTANNAADQALLRHFGVIGPPAILFFGANSSEQKASRVMGFLSAERFKVHVEQTLLNIQQSAAGFTPIL